MPILRVGMETGGKEAGDAMAFIHKALNNEFFYDRNLNGYFNGIDFFIMALRVSGRFKDFISEGPDSLGKSRGQPYIGIDYVIPEQAWRNVSFEKKRAYMVEVMTTAFDMLVKKANKLGVLKDETKLRADIKRGLDNIATASEDDDIFHVAAKGLAIRAEKIAAVEARGETADMLKIGEEMTKGNFD